MNILKILILNDLRLLIKSYRLSLLILFAFLVTGLTAYIQVLDFEERQKNYIEEYNKLNDDREYLVYSQIEVPILFAPNPLSIFAKGFEEKTGNKAIISPLSCPELLKISQKTNPFLVIFSDFDITAVINILMSFVVIFMLSDSISGEKESGVLKVIMVNNVGRFKYFISKYLSSMFLVGIILLIIFIITLIFWLLNTYLIFDKQIGIEIFEIFMGSIFYLSIFVLVSLVISMLSDSKSNSFIWGLSIWIFLFFIYPSGINYLVKDGSNSSFVKLQSGIKEIEETFLSRMSDFKENEYHNKQVHYYLMDGFNDRLVSLFPKLYGVTEKYEFEFRKRLLDNFLPQLRKIQSEIEERKDGYEQQITRREQLVSSFMFFLPNKIYQNTSNAFAKTDKQTCNIELKQALSEYYRIFLNHLKTKNAFGYSFFTQMTSDLMKDQHNDYAPRIFERYGQLENYNKINLSDMPVFNYSPKNRLPLSFLGLLIYNAILLILGWVLFDNVKITN